MEKFSNCPGLQSFCRPKVFVRSYTGLSTRMKYCKELVKRISVVDWTSLWSNRGFPKFYLSFWSTLTNKFLKDSVT